MLVPSLRNRRLAEIAATVFKVPVASLNADTAIGSIAAWDSLTHLELVFAVEEAFGVRFLMSRILGFASLGDFELELEHMDGDS